MRLALGVLGALAVASHAAAYTVGIKDTDDYHEVCSGMYGGDKAYIEVAFDAGSDGQVALVIYEWADVDALGVATSTVDEQGFDYPLKTYICTSKAVTSGLCKTAQLGSFIVNGNASTIYTTPLRFISSSSSSSSDEEPASVTTSAEIVVETPYDPTLDGDRRKRRLARAAAIDDAEGMPKDPVDAMLNPPDFSEDDSQDTPTATIDAVENEADVPVYSKPIHYDVPKTGYYCVGVVPVTLHATKRELLETLALASRQADAVHGAYSGAVTFKNQFTGELPAAEYPKIAFYGALSIVYLLLAAGWGYLCFKHRSELLPMQHYISGTIAFLNVEMLALFAYYRYVNKHGGGAGSLAFLIVISILNAARNSLSFFLLLIVSMGLSVVTQTLGSVMNRVRLLTAFHFIFGVAYAVGTVKLDIDSASLFVVLATIFPLSMSLTAFFMWIIISLNGTILNLQQRKQHFKLQMFQRLWRILIMSCIAVAGFFVLSSISLSNRLDEDYAPNNWRYRWVLLDASLAIIYLVAFTAIAWLWRPTENNVRFAMSQELSQDENEAEDYEIHSLELPRSPPGLSLEPDEGRIRIHGDEHSDDEDDDEDNLKHERKGLFKSGAGGQVRDDNVVFAMGDDSDDEGAHGMTNVPLNGGGSSSEGHSRRTSGSGHRLLGDSDDERKKSD